MNKLAPGPGHGPGPEPGPRTGIGRGGATSAIAHSTMGDAFDKHE